MGDTPQVKESGRMVGRKRLWIGIRRAAALALLVVVVVLALNREEARAHELAMDGWSSLANPCRSLRPFSWISDQIGKERPSIIMRVFMGRMIRPADFPPPPVSDENVRALRGGGQRK